MTKITRPLAAIVCFAATSLLADDELALRLQPALETITPDGLLAHIKILVSDEFEGRAPGTKGEELSVKYIADQFKQIGLRPGNPDGTYTQEVPLAGITSEPRMSFSVRDKTVDLKYPDGFVASSARLKPEIKIDKSDVIFVGYGVVAPEYGWDDYKDVDVRGKTLLMLIGDPPVPDPKYPAKLDDKMFKGKAMTYYGRWTYKYEIAAQKGAAASIIIHETEPAAYPWQVVRSSWGKENFELDNPNKNMDAISVRSWITLEVAKKLFTDCGQDFDALKKSAITKEFRPVRFNAKANIDIKQQIRSFKSHNVIGKLEGNDPKLKDEYVIYTAHWDHLGRHPELQGDQIFNGAIDNASGVASVIQLAAIASARSRANLVVCLVHWGIENSANVTDKQRELARWLVNRGVDLVVGSHPHCVQPLDFYHGCPIAYSLGNLVFDGAPSVASWNRGALLEIGLNENAQTSASRLVPLILEDGFPRIDAAMESNTSETSKAFAVGK